MEDILASIRRIIADDQSQVGRGLPGTRRSAPPAIPAPVVHEPAETEQTEPYEDVLDLATLPDAAIVEPQPAQAEAPAEQPELHARQPEPLPIFEPAPYTNGYAAETFPHDLGAQAAPQPESEIATSQDLAPSHEASDGLISPKLGASVMSSFETLAATVVLQNQDMLDRVMHDALRPLLKTWLDENLPSLVERLVRSEIERMARGIRG